MNVNTPTEAKEALQRSRAENQQRVSDERGAAVLGMQRRIDAAFDQPGQGYAGKIGGDQRNNAKKEQSAVAVNEKLDPMIIVKNLSIL